MELLPGNGIPRRTQDIISLAIDLSFNGNPMVDERVLLEQMGLPPLADDDEL